jgi:hypothetical protein
MIKIKNKEKIEERKENVKIFVEKMKKNSIAYYEDLHLSITYEKFKKEMKTNKGWYYIINKKTGQNVTSVISLESLTDIYESCFIKDYRCSTYGLDSSIRKFMRNQKIKDLCFVITSYQVYDYVPLENLNNEQHYIKYMRYFPEHKINVNKVLKQRKYVRMYDNLHKNAVLEAFLLREEETIGRFTIIKKKTGQQVIAFADGSFGLTIGKVFEKWMLNENLNERISFERGWVNLIENKLINLEEIIVIIITERISKEKGEEGIRACETS